MKRIKLLFMCVLLIVGTTIFQSCSDSDSCEGVICEFDGGCDDGTCICVDLTENFLIGTWDLSSTSATFNEDKTYIDGFGNVVTWEFNASTRTISLTPGNMLIVSENGFSCTQMNVSIDNGSTVNEFTFIRQ